MDILEDIGWENNLLYLLNNKHHKEDFMSNNDISGPYSDPNNTPPLGEASALGLQHVLAMFASTITGFFL